MNNLADILNSTHNAHKKQIDETKGLVTKWSKTGLLEGLEEYEAHGTAILLENQAQQLIREASSTGTASNSEEWSGVALPLVRRIFNEIAAKDFVSVQPMNLPSGLVFYLDFKYGTSQPGFTNGSGKDSQADSVFGVTNASGDPTGGLYGAGKFGYSINEATSSALTGGAAPTSTVFASASATDTNFNFDANFSASKASTGTIWTVTVASASLDGNPTGTKHDKEGIRAFQISGSGIHEYYPAYTTTTASDHQITFVVSGSSTAPIAGVVVTYQCQPTDITRGDFEENGSNQTPDPLDIPEINIEMRSDPIVAKTRKLKAVWTPEFAQDLNAYHSIDAEAELTSMLSEYISQEIDLEILDMLIQNAITTDFWSADIGQEYDSASTSFSAMTNAAAGAYTKNQWFQTLGIKIQKVSNKIHQKTMRGGANFIVVSPDVATVLESMPGYNSDTDGTAWGAQGFAFGVQKVGMLNNRMQVYKNPYMLENTVLMGYRGSQFLETGAVYAPYVPLIMTPLVYDPTNFTPRKAVMTRYAKQIVRPEFYGVIRVADMDKI